MTTPARTAGEVWRGARPAARRAAWAAVVALLLVGLPVVGLVAAGVAAALAVRARRADVAADGDPSRLATIALLAAVLATVLATLFTGALALLLVVGA